MVVTQEQLNEYYAAEVVDQDGGRVGSMGEIYLDNRTGDPAWLTVRTGFLGGRKVFVPLVTAEIRDGQIFVPYSSAKIKGAPDVPADPHLSDNEEQDLYQYYAVQEGPAPSA